MSQNLKKRNPVSFRGKRELNAPRRGAAIPDWEEPAPAEREERSLKSTLSILRVRTRRKIRHIQRRWWHIVREVHKHNFPESERAPILLVLFAWNMLPMLGSLLREKTWGRRKQLLHSAERMWANMERHRLHPAMFLGLGCTLAVVIALCSVYTVGTTVTYDG